MLYDIWVTKASKIQVFPGSIPRHLPEHPLALQQVLQTQQPLLALRPVGAGAVVQHLGHVLRLTQVVWRHAAVARAVRALRAGAGGVAVGVVVRVHAWRLKAPPHRPPLSTGEGERRRQTGFRKTLQLVQLKSYYALPIHSSHALKTETKYY